MLKVLINLLNLCSFICMEMKIKIGELGEDFRVGKPLFCGWLCC